MARQAANIDGGFGLYVHWPFCAAKCPYCDFNSHVRAGIDHDIWAKALIKDLESQAQFLGGVRYSLNSIFFGGGTPSLMAPKTVGMVIETAARLFPFADDIEISLEANPTSSEKDKFSDLRSAGIGRVSLGLQALRDEALKALGRRHTAAEGIQAFEAASRVFDRTSFDLIYARPGQLTVDWRAELQQAIDMAGEHMSLYQLTIEPGTKFHQLADIGQLTPLEPALGAELYEITQEMMNDAGLLAYEISNHAKPGAESRHNLVYWRGGAWLGVGPGAHGRLPNGIGRTGTDTHKHPETWLKTVSDQGHGLTVQSALQPRDQAIEMVLMGLRLAEGIDLTRIEAISPHIINRGVLDDLQADGFVEMDNGNLRATPKGRPVLNYLIGQLISDP